ncbi:hypothetical protein NIS_0457 [Nitratiruptor sp. SB155-2]|nr:hypothetical protein NIS_0457 [Nitratiruptor sp. SB155-2]BAN05331.1 hypothetical protein [Nitratiruptor phage NrS-1]
MKPRPYSLSILSGRDLRAFWIRLWGRYCGYLPETTPKITTNDMASQFGAPKNVAISKIKTEASPTMITSIKKAAIKITIELMFWVLICYLLCKLFYYVGITNPLWNVLVSFLVYVLVLSLHFLIRIVLLCNDRVELLSELLALQSKKESAKDKSE